MNLGRPDFKLLYAWCRGLAWVALVGLFAPLAWAQDDADDSHSETVVTSESFVVSLERSDFKELLQGVIDGYLKGPLSGHYAEPIAKSFWFGTLGIEGMSYSFELEHLDASPENAYVHASLGIKNLQVNVERLFFNKSGSRYCTNLAINSQGGSIAVALDLIPRVSSHRFDLAIENQTLALNSGNFATGKPAKCHVLWGMNWAIRQVIPWVTSVVRGQLEDSIKQAIATAAQSIGDTYGGILDMNIMLPIGIEPAPSFYATLGLWPSAVHMSSERFQFVLGTDVNFDPDPRDFEYGGLPTLRSVPYMNEVMSYLGISKGFIQAVLAEAHNKGLYRVTIDQNSLPDSGDLLTTTRLAELLPDAASRFGKDQVVSLAFKDGADTRVLLHPHGPGGVPIIETIVDRQAFEIKVDGEPYYTILLNSSLKCQFGVEPTSRMLVFRVIGAEGQFVAGRFASELSPAPSDRHVNEQALREFLLEFEERILDKTGTLLAIGIPDIAIGNRTLEIKGTSIRDEVVAIDATVIHR